MLLCVCVCSFVNIVQYISMHPNVFDNNECGELCVLANILVNVWLYEY